MSVHQGERLAVSNPSSAFQSAFQYLIVALEVVAPASGGRVGTDSMLPEMQKRNFAVDSGGVAVA